ncbi:MAG: hypothetical protein J6K25_15960 [Thermoguttaceae bacterium]|nr:hypothetical protein [Thermoguttaceae bacterium]MBP3532650.1 hypothetical protein [Thermoguttaceae bacterium]
MGTIAISVETLSDFNDVKKALFGLVQPGTPVESAKLLDVYSGFAKRLDEVFAALKKTAPARQEEEEVEEKDDFDKEILDVDYALDYKRFVLQVAHDMHVAEQKQVHACDKAYAKAKEHVKESVEEAFEALNLYDADAQDVFICDATDAFNRM